MKHAGHIRRSVQVLAATVHQEEVVAAEAAVTGRRCPIVDDGAVLTVSRYGAIEKLCISFNMAKIIILVFLSC